MDPELYIFPNISSVPIKVAVSTTLFLLALLAASLLMPLLPERGNFGGAVDWGLAIGPYTISAFRLLHLLLGYGLFIYASICAWRATREKNSVEDARFPLATRLLDSGYYGRVRHPMYAMFILANTGLGFAMCSVYGLIFSLLSLVLFTANGVYEERAVMIRFFGEQYRDYMRRVSARFFTPGWAALLLLFLALQFAGVYFR